MHTYNSPTPRVFGKGYGGHLAYNLRLAKLFTRLVFVSIIHAFAPTAYVEKAHWQIIEMYYKHKGLRHGTMDPKRCDHCGSTLEPQPEIEPTVVNNLPPVIVDKLYSALADQPATAAKEK